MKYIYKTRGTCSTSIAVALDKNGVIEKVDFVGGCSGNLRAICKLVEGKSAQEMIHLLRGTRCGMRLTSCPDQLTYALEKALKQG